VSARVANLHDPATPEGQAVLQEQFRTLTRQLPLMYGTLLVNSCFLAFFTRANTPFWLSIGVPGALCAAVILRMGVWLHRRKSKPDVAAIGRSLRSTIVAGAILAVLFNLWGQLLFTEADLVQRSCIGLFIFINCVSVCYCLQCLPWAGQLVLLFGGAPMAVRLLTTGDWLLMGLGLNILFISAVILKVLGTNYAAFTGLLLSRLKVLAERERAREAEERASALAYQDSLTGLPNRNALRTRVDELTGSCRDDEAFALLIVDLDRFKPVNDVHGHFAGDQLLREVANRISDVAKEASVYRLGGDEFAVLIKSDAGGAAIHAVAQELVEGLSRPFYVGDLVHHIGASVGSSNFPADGRDRETLLRRADIALYRAKESGRNQYRAFQPTMEAQITRRSIVERELRSAIAADELRPYYQPLVDLSSGRTVGFELLARWPRADGAEIGPDEFIPVAEESGLINELMLKLLERACADARGWDPELTLAINISPVQLRDPWLSGKVLAAVTRMGFAPQRLVIEITENALIDEAEYARRTIASFKSQGMKIELDDFGTGYSSLRHLRMLPFDKIKIDRSFVQAIGDDQEALKIVRAIITLALSLDLPVIAEGIESELVAAQLRELGCAEGQGYHFGRPMSGDQVNAHMGRPAAGDASSEGARDAVVSSRRALQA
jgi:diguanylate cyclase (GGDEF)-like protein